MSRVLPQVVGFLEALDFPSFLLDVPRDQVIEFLGILRENPDIYVHRLIFPVENMTNHELADMLTSKDN